MNALRYACVLLVFAGCSSKTESPRIVDKDAGAAQDAADSGMGNDASLYADVADARLDTDVADALDSGDVPETEGPLPACVCGEVGTPCRPCTKADERCTAFATKAKCTAQQCLESTNCTGGGGMLHCASGSMGPTCVHCDPPVGCDIDASTCGEKCPSEAGACNSKSVDCVYCPGIWEGDCGVATATMNVCQCKP